jgi:hypothetical protein
MDQRTRWLVIENAANQLLHSSNRADVWFRPLCKVIASAINVGLPRNCGPKLLDVSPS